MPWHASLWEQDTLEAAACLYLKAHSQGEFVFDFSWADAYHRYGIDYYPKLLCAAPFTPATGPRLMAQTDSKKIELIQAIITESYRIGVSSTHFNFIESSDCHLFGQFDVIKKLDWQFLWSNQGYSDFDDFLSYLKSTKRKKIKQERKSIEKQGIKFQIQRGEEISEINLQAAYRAYQHTFLQKQNHAPLNYEFFKHIQYSLGDQLLIITAYLEGSPVGSAIYFCTQHTLYGRYWGSDGYLPNLHFETCYYQAIDYCIRNQIKFCHPGAQGEHKISRGFNPTPTQSFHHIADGRFRQAISAHVGEENEYLRDYYDKLNQNTAYKVQPCFAG